MTLKRWVLGKVNPGADPVRGNGRIAPSLRDDAGGDAGAGVPGRREMGVRRESLREAAHLGRYAQLVSAIRDELEQFVTNELRLHLAIAERDRFVLTSIEVECEDSEEHRELLRRFMREFKPEQIKQYLARDVIAALRNASAIDLSQFAGLNATRERDAMDEEEDAYAELVAQLQSQSPDQPARPYTVRLLGRWSEQASQVQRETTQQAKPHAAAMAQTPLSARSYAFEVADAKGARSVELAVVSGKRYTIGKGDGCDIVVDGVYASRQHCEIWLERERWWVADTGSTNGIRVEANGTAQRRGASAGNPAPALQMPAGAMLVLSAYGDADSAQYPRLHTPAAAHDETHPATLVTPIAPARRARSPWSITAQMASGRRDAEIVLDALPFRIGRSRNQALVIDWKHGDVSGHHVEIVALDDAGASVLVHGDNGVMVDGTAYAAGAQLRWKPGEEMVLGREDGDAPGCRLTLSRDLQ